MDIIGNLLIDENGLVMGKFHHSTDLQGRRFGKLLVLSRVYGSQKWLCECTGCGRTKECFSSNLLSGRTTSCGKYPCKRGTRFGFMYQKSDELIGTTVGELTVLSKSPNKPHGMAVMVCRCSCGDQTSVYARNIRSGHTRSCGKPACRQRAMVKKRQERKLMAMLNEARCGQIILYRDPTTGNVTTGQLMEKADTNEMRTGMIRPLSMEEIEQHRYEIDEAIRKLDHDAA